MSFSQSILCTVVQEVPLLFLAPADNNNLSLCSFMENIPLPPSPLVGGKLMYIPIVLTKAETKRDTFFASLRCKVKSSFD